MPWRDAVRPTAAGVQILLEARPGAKATRFPAGHDPWRGRIGIHVQAPPEDGKANRAVVAEVARVLGVPTRLVRITAGGTGTRKTVEVDGMGRDDALAVLEASL